MGRDLDNSSKTTQDKNEYTKGYSTVLVTRQTQTKTTKIVAIY